MSDSDNEKEREAKEKAKPSRGASAAADETKKESKEEKNQGSSSTSADSGNGGGSGSDDKNTNTKSGSQVSATSTGANSSGSTSGGDNKSAAANAEQTSQSTKAISAATRTANATNATKFASHKNANVTDKAGADAGASSSSAAPAPAHKSAPAPAHSPPPSITAPIPKIKRANTTGNFAGSSSSSSSDNINKSAFGRSRSDVGYYHNQHQQGQGIDAHPYARGSVIEVLYGVSSKVLGDGYGSDEDDEDDDDEGDHEEEEMMDHRESQGMGGLSSSSSGNAKQDVRLADIIDRAPSNTPNHELPCYRWKYYIHYREYNRRMDEWITDPTRIVSPPSIGNAKVRAMKKAQAAKQEEERRMREREKREREALALAEVHDKRRKLGGDGDGGGDGADGSGTLSSSSHLSPFPRPVSQRASSRRASAAIAASSSNHQSSSSAVAASLDLDGGSSSAALDEQERLRLTRSQRRKSARGGGGNVTDDLDGEAGNQKKVSSSTTVTTLLPDDEIIQDKVVTVAAQELDEHEGLDEAALREHEEVTKVKNVKEVELGRYRMDTWYYSPLPKEMLRGGSMIDVLYVCEFTLQFFTRKEELVRFQQKYLPKNPRRHPPGNEIYRNGNLSMFEIDGFEERIYCQNLCYIAKLFLDHKTLYFDVDPFLFYVLCEIDDRGFHPVGYYSKEKYSDVGYNLACILTFPCHQRKGYGRFLIDFSYELSKKEEKVGSPEKPMSDLGQQAYKPYWTSTIVDFLLNKSDEKSMSIMDISKRTSIMAEDIIFTLNMLGLLKYINGVYFITAEPSLLKELAKKHPVKEPSVDPSKLHWTPYLTDVKRDKFSIHSKKPSIEGEVKSEKGGF